MKKTLLFRVKTAALAVMSVLAFASCQDDEKKSGGDNEGGEKIECQQVYFSEENQDLLFANPSESSNTVVLTVCRQKADGAISVPVTINKNTSEELTIPATVDFSDTAKTAQLVISYPANAEIGSLYTYDLELTGKHVDAYATVGKSVIAGRISIPEIIKAKTYLQDSKYETRQDFGFWATEVWKVSENHMILKNICGSDFDVTLKGTLYDEEYNLWHMTVESEVGYNEYDETYNDYTWYFTDNDSDWVSMYPYGEDAWFYIASLSFLHYGDNPDGDGYGIYYYPESGFLNITCTMNWYSTSTKYAYYDNLIVNLAVTDFEPTLPEYVEPEINNDGNINAYFSNDNDEYGEFKMNGTWEGNTLVIEDFMNTGMSLSLVLDAETGSVSILDDEIGYNTETDGGLNYWFYAGGNYVELCPDPEDYGIYGYAYIDNDLKYTTYYPDYGMIYICMYAYVGSEWVWYDTLVIEVPDRE